MKRAILLLVLLGLPFGSLNPILVLAGESPDSDNHCSLRLAIGSMGRSDEADQFRFLLEDELRRRNFEVVSKDADATLSGTVLTREQFSGARFTTTFAYVTIALRRPDGAEIWRGYFKPGNRRYKHGVRKGKSSLELRVYDVGQSLQEACAKGWPSQDK